VLLFSASDILSSSLLTVSTSNLTVPNLTITNSLTTTVLSNTTCPIQIVGGSAINISQSNAGFTYVLTSSNSVYINPTSISAGYFNYIKAGVAGPNILPINITGLSVLSNLALWLDAADPYGTGIVPTNGTIISTWTDKSGQGNSGIAGGYPVYSNAQITTNNDDHFVSSYQIGSAETVFIVATVPTTTGTGTVAKLLVDPLYTPDSRSFSIQDNVQTLSAGGGETLLGVLTVPQSMSIFEYTLSSTEGQLYLNTATDGPAVSVTATVPTTTYIGFQSSVTFQVSEILIYSRVLTQSERQSVEGYLNSKWGISRIAGSSNSTPRLWLDGADPYGTGTAPSPGTVISRWVDKSGSGNSGIATGSITFSNGIVLTGSQHFTTPYTAASFTETLFVVFSMTNSNSTSLSPLVHSSLTNGRFFGVSTSTLPMNLSIGSVGQAPYSDTIGLTSNTLYLAECTYNSNAINFFVSGNAGFSNALTITPTAGTTLIGGDGSTRYFNGRLCEVILYNTVLPQTTRQNIENYLCGKWGILPANPSLQLWLDAADPYGTGTPPADGTIIRTWTDKSGNALNALGVNFPTYSSSNGIILNGTQRYTVSYPGTHTPETGFIVVNITSSTATSFILHGGTGGQRAVYASNGTINLATAAINASNSYPNGVICILDYTLSSASNATLNRNGTPGTSISIASPAAETGITIGTTDTGTLGLVGSVCEILIYNTVLSSNQREVVQGYLSKKWGVSVSANPFSNTSLSPQPTLRVPTTGQPNINIGYQVASANVGNPGTSTLYYNGYEWSLN
jgi:hypothetical protein